jgi:hypothetical protein
MCVVACSEYYRAVSFFEIMQSTLKSIADRPIKRQAMEKVFRFAWYFTLHKENIRWIIILLS